MIHNYIAGLANYSQRDVPLAFFSYIAGGFSNKINEQIHGINVETGVSGSAINVSNFIKLIEKQKMTPYTHSTIRELFSMNRQILLGDL